MKCSIKSLLAALVLSLSLAAPAVAGLAEDGTAAYDRGDYATALRLMRPLAEQGSADGQLLLALMNHQGQGVPQDYVKAYKWYSLVVARGNELARYVQDTAREARVIVARKMTPAQIAEAQRLAREWKQKKEAHERKPKPKKEAHEYDMLVTVLEPKSGKKSIRRQMITSQSCNLLLKNFEKAQRESAPFTMTFTDPDVTGNILDIYCIRPNGEAVHPHGFVGTLLDAATAMIYRNDYRTALRIFRALVEQGNTIAQWKLGGMYEFGNGVPQDNAKAAALYRKVAHEHGFDGGKTIVKDYVRKRRQHSQEVFVPLTHAPGHAQVDFGEALAVIGGVELKVHFLAMDLAHSDACFVKAYPGETTEAFCDGHVSAFAFFGGVPLSILYDNTRIAVARILGDGRREPCDWCRSPQALVGSDWRASEPLHLGVEATSVLGQFEPKIPDIQSGSS